MKQWQETEFFQNTTWYHATTRDSAINIIKKGVCATINKGKELDFGYGFYVTPNKEWAHNYLVNQLLVSDEDNVIEPDDGYVLQFEFDPAKYIRQYKIKFIDKLDTKFAKYVYFNRMHPHLSYILSHYDMMGGPMSDGKQLDDFTNYKLGRITKGELFDELLKPKEDWQLVLRNQAICDTLRVRKAFNTKGEETDEIF